MKFNRKWINNIKASSKIKIAILLILLCIGVFVLSIEVFPKIMNNMDLNIVKDGKSDMIWTWWSYPQVVSYKGKHNCLYWGFTTKDGYSGVASYDFDTGKINKNLLKKSEVDDHNAPAVLVRQDGHIIVAYASGHNSGNCVYVRHSSENESIENFSKAIKIESPRNVSYAQLIEYKDKLFLFSRSGYRLWQYVVSDDYGLTWSDWTVLVSAPMQYYIKLTRTTENGLFRINMYSNPTSEDPRIRQGFIDLDNMNVYNSDRYSFLGNSDISYDSFDVIIDLESPEKYPHQRLFDVAITEPETCRILYAPFSDDMKGDAIYKLYDAGKVVDICDAGSPLWIPKYQLGCSFIDSSSLVVAYNDNNEDIISLWEYDGSEANEVRKVYAEATGNEPIRNARPIVDINGKAIIWHRGYYNPNSYTDFDTEAAVFKLPKTSRNL